MNEENVAQRPRVNVDIPTGCGSRLVARTIGSHRVAVEVLQQRTDGTWRTRVSVTLHGEQVDRLIGGLRGEPQGPPTVLDEVTAGDSLAWVACRRGMSYVDAQTELQREMAG